MLSSSIATNPSSIATNPSRKPDSQAKLEIHVYTSYIVHGELLSLKLCKFISGIGRMGNSKVVSSIYNTLDKAGHISSEEHLKLRHHYHQRWPSQSHFGTDSNTSHTHVRAL